MKKFINKNLLFISLSSKRTLQNSIHTYILKHLKLKFKNIFIFCRGGKFYTKEDNLHYLSGNFPNWFSYLKKIKKINCLYINDFFVGGLFGVIVKKSKNIPLYFRCGSPWKYQLNSISSIIKAIITSITKPIVIKNCNKIVYNSKAIVQKQYRHNWGVVYNGVDLNLFKPIPGNKASKKFNLLYIGRIRQEKGLDYLFQATQHLKDKLHLGIIGEGNRLIHYRTKYPFAQYYNRINYPHLPSIINQYDLIVLPSLTKSSESFPNVLLEAMACGKPVIGTNVWGIPEIINHGQTGYLIPEKDPAALINTLLKVINNKKLYLQLKKDCRKTITKKFDKKERIQELIDTLLP